MLMKPPVRKEAHRHAATLPSPSMTVAVLGAGVMGGAIAARLLSTGMALSVWSRHPSSTTDLVGQGATAYADAAEAVASADVVITMLPTAQATSELMLQRDILDAFSPGSVWAQMGTIGVAATEELAVALQASRPDVGFVDAPVSGSRVPAETGQLLILASGPTEAAGKLHPVFGALGRSTLWLGPAGKGSQMKLVLNTWLAFQTEGAAESAALAEQFGLRTDDLRAALQDNPLASAYAVAKLDRMLASDYHVDFALEWALKDLDLVAEEAAEAAPVAVSIAQRWRQVVRDGWGESDVSAVRNELGHAHTEGGGRS